MAKKYLHVHEATKALQLSGQTEITNVPTHEIAFAPGREICEGSHSPGPILYAIINPVVSGFNAGRTGIRISTNEEQ